MKVLIAKTDVFERYLTEEFYDDYREGSLDRGAFTRHVAFIRGSMAAVGCAPDELPAATEPMPTATLAPPPAADSGSAGRTPSSQPSTSAATGNRPFSIPTDDSVIVAEDVIFNSDADEISGHLARPVTGGYVALAIDLFWREGSTAAFDRDAVPGMLTGAGRHLADFQAGLEILRTAIRNRC